MKKIFKIMVLCVVYLTLFSCAKKNKEVKTAVSSEETKASAEATTEIIDVDDSVYDMAEGIKMPNVKVETNKGTVFDLDKTTKPVLINFWTTWCPPCRMEMPGLQSLYEEYRDRVDFVMINLGETKETIQDFLVENEVYTFPIGYDTTDAYGLKFGILSIPTTYIISKDKTLKHYIIGARHESQFKEYLEEVIK